MHFKCTAAKSPKTHESNMANMKGIICLDTLMIDLKDASSMNVDVQIQMSNDVLHLLRLTFFYVFIKQEEQRLW